MSLINDALRDLDARSSFNDSADDATGTQGLNPKTPNSENSRSHRGALSVKSIGVITLSCCAIYFTWQYLQSPAKNENLPEPDRIAESSVAASKTQEVAAPLLVEEKKPLATQENAVSEPPDAKLSSTVAKADLDALLEKLDIAIARNRLSVPFQANALFFLEQIKALDAPAEVIEASRERIQAAYIEQIEQAIAQEKLQFAGRLLDRANKFGINGAAVTRYQDQLAQIDLEARQRNTVDLASANASREESAVNQQAHNDKNGLSASQDKPVNQVFTPSTSYREKQLLEKANVLMSQGRFSQAELALRDYLSHNPVATKPLLVLFDSYIKRKAYGQAKALASKLSNQHEAHAYFSAQLAKYERGTSAAISILEQHPPTRSVENAHNALLAGLYQKSERYQEAHQMYTALIKRDPNNSVNLLGFALSADALKRYDRSISAYKQIISLGQVSPNVMTFVKKRVATLDKDQIAGAQKW